MENHEKGFPRMEKKTSHKAIQAFFNETFLMKTFNEINVKQPNIFLKLCLKKLIFLALLSVSETSLQNAAPI